MVEVSEIGLKEEEVELDLGLSIGGSLRRSGKPVQPDSKPNGLELNPKDYQYQQQHQALYAKREATAVVDPKTKREIHALRRLEAKKKREEKQQQKRAVREPEFEPDHQQGVSKREKTDYLNGRSECLNVNLNLNGSEQQSAHCNTVGLMASFQHPYAYVQLNNGYAYPCVMPWMANQNNAGPPATACKGFRPFSGNGYRPDLNGERDNGDKKAKSDVSSMCSSSVVSDHQSSSHEGRGSTDSHSHSAHSLAEPTQFNSSKEGNITSQPDQTASSNPIRSEHANVQSTNHNATQPDQIKSKEQGHTKTLSNETVMGKKPPKPQPQPQSSPLPSLPKMPYVSTTGNGPNGRRVNGFLYRYSNSEVSIVCVCHGSTFSPAGFVQHAGGTDTSHPERHITVIPPAFG